MPVGVSLLLSAKDRWGNCVMKDNQKKGMLRHFGRYCRDTSAVVAIIFGLVAPVLVGSAGVAVDLGRAYNVKNRLGNALDKAALAAASSSGDEAALQEIAQNFFDANFPDARLGTPYDVTLVLGEDDTISVSARATVDTTFMRVFGEERMDVAAYTQVKRELMGVEAVLVLDVTGSMAGSRITALKTAGTNFLNIMFDRISDTDYIKVGVVPYSDTINVGPYGLGLDTSGGVYGTPFIDRPATDSYVADPSTLGYNTGSSSQWWGCITERTYPDDTTDESAPNWGMYRYPRTCTRWSGGTCTRWSGTANRGCISSANMVLPMTNTQATIQSRISGLATGGNTYGNVGMAWGWHVISPSEPYAEGVDYDDRRWTKTVIMMTDGDNTVDTGYAVYGSYSTNPMTVDDLNERFEEICTSMKEEGIRIYTITFQSGISDDTRDYYRRCATDETMYYNAPSDADLVAAFETIADQLSRLHITQ